MNDFMHILNENLRSALDAPYSAPRLRFSVFISNCTMPRSSSFGDKQTSLSLSSTNPVLNRRAFSTSHYALLVRTKTNPSVKSMKVFILNKITLLKHQKIKILTNHSFGGLNPPM